MIEQINHIAGAWWQWTWMMFWQVGLLIVLIALLDGLIRRWAWPQVRYALWSLILIKLILPPSLSLPTGLTPKLRPFLAQALEATISPSQVEEELPPAIPLVDEGILRLPGPPVPYRLLSVESISPVEGPVTGESPIHRAGPELDWQVYAMAVWLLGAAALGVWLLVKLGRLTGECPDESSRPVLPQSFHDQLARCAERLNLRRKPKLVVTDNIRTPAVFGLFRPILLMPIGYIRRLSRKDTEHLLLHELAHVKRGDLITHGLYMFLQLAYWYNPLLWLVRRRLRHLRELCCDATVASLLMERTAEYRRTLLEAARQFLCTPVEHGLGLVGLFEDSNCLISRINRLEKPIWRHQTMKKLITTTTILVLLACVLPMAQARQESASENPGSGSKVAKSKPAQSSKLSEAETEQQKQLLKSMKDLEAQLQKLELQKQQLHKELQELHAMSQGRHAEEQAVKADIKAKDAKEKAERALVKDKGVKEKAAKALVKDKEAAKEKSAKAAADGPAAADAKQWAKEMETWAEQQKAWANSDDFKQWQKGNMQEWAKGVQQWADDMARMKADMQDIAADPAPAPASVAMPAMPPMPPMATKGAMPVMPKVPVIAAPKVKVPVESVPQVDAPAKTPGMVPVPPAKREPGGDAARAVEVKNDKDGKHAATRAMQFVAKVGPGSPFVVRNSLGNIILRPRKDGACGVTAVIRAKAKTAAEAQGMVEQVSMNVRSSGEGYYLAPVKQDGGPWNDLSVDLYVALPAGVQPDVQTNMGSVELYELEGKIKAATNMGSIKAVNTTGDVELFTKMGSIEFIAPKDLSAKLNAQTKMGSIKSDLPLEVNQSDMFRKSAQGTVGTGQGNIRLTTDMGSINVKWQSVNQESPEN